MTILRIIIDNEFLSDNHWEMVNGSDKLGDGLGSLPSLIEMEYEYLEIYLAPHLTTIFSVDIEHISDRKINDELLLGLIEDNLVDELDECKPLLMRLTDGEAYVAVLNKDFYTSLIEALSDKVKQVKFIQPIPLVTKYIEGKFTICLTEQFKFIRTSQFEYYLLDDGGLIPDVLDIMLKTYEDTEVVLYTDNPAIEVTLKEKYNLNVIVEDSLDYGVLTWNFYNQKSRRFKFKLNNEHKKGVSRLLKSSAVFLGLLTLFWIVNFGYLVIAKYRLESQVKQELSGVVRVDSYQPNLLTKVNDQIGSMYHSKGIYASNDFIPLFNAFLDNFPEVNQFMIVGIKYSGDVLEIFLNSQFSNNNFENYREILLSKKILVSATDYSSYQAQSDNKNNNGGGVLSDNSANTAQMSDAKWVISIQNVNRLDLVNVSSTQTAK